MKSQIPLHLNLSKYRQLDDQPTEKTKYRSKYVQKLLQSQSSSSEESQENDDSIENFKQVLTEKMPPLVSKKLQFKENIPSVHNIPNSKSNIKYQSFKIQGKQLVQCSKTHEVTKYNSINLDEASIIPDRDDILTMEYEKLTKKYQQQKNHFDKQLKKKSNENVELEREICLLREDLKEKDQTILELKLQCSQLSTKLTKTDEKLKTKFYGSKKKQEKVLPSKFLSNHNLYDTDKGELKVIDKVKNQQNSEQIYSQVLKHLAKIVSEFKDKLIDKKMSPSVERILQNFMAEIVNLNPIAVKSSKNQNKEESFENKKSYVTIANFGSRNPISEQISSHNYKSQIHRTPVKENQRDKSSDLRQLQKSLHKLREMQKSFVSNTPNQKDNFDSLDRSSLMMLDRSAKSKSRRKKIFQ